MSKIKDINQLKDIVGNRDIYIYSLNIEGLGLSRLFRKDGFSVKGFIDSRDFGKTERDNLPIIHPDKFFKYHKDDFFLILASKNRRFKKQIIEELENLGLKRYKDFVLAIEDLCDYMPTIEPMGRCNLRCISCECGHKDVVNTGKMSVDLYDKILTKMQKEIPFLNSVYLYLWGEPLLHPEIDKFIEITREKGLASDVSTNLNSDKFLEKFIASNPDYVAVPCSGVGKNYEITHTGGNWENFKKNLYLLREYIDKYDVDTTVRIMFHLYKHNIKEDYFIVKELSKELGFQFYPILAMAFPGKIYDYKVHNKPLPEELIELDKYLLFSIEEQLQYAYSKRNTKCPVWKVFPTIRSDGSVLICCNMMHYQLHKNYLDISLDELNKIREDNEVCRSCMQFGLHRFFDVIANVYEKEGKVVVERP